MLQLTCIEPLITWDITIESTIHVIYPAFKGEKIDSSDLSSVLGDLEIELTKKEQERLLETLPADGKPSLNFTRILWKELQLVKM